METQQSSVKANNQKFEPHKDQNVVEWMVSD